MSIEIQFLDWLSKNWQNFPVPFVIALGLIVVLYVRYTLMRVAKSNQRRIAKLERQMHQIQKFHAINHPEEGSEIIEGNESSPDPES